MSSSETLHLIPLRQLLLNPELSWWPTSPSSTRVSTLSAGIKDMGDHTHLFYVVWGFELSSSRLCNSHSTRTMSSQSTSTSKKLCHYTDFSLLEKWL